MARMANRLYLGSLRFLFLFMLLCFYFENGSYAYYPVISNLKVSFIYAASVTVSWSTNVPATTQIMYGIQSAYENSITPDNNLTQYHQVRLTNLYPGTTYKFQVVSEDYYGYNSFSSTNSFTTTALPNPISNRAILDLPFTAPNWDILWTGYGFVNFSSTNGILMQPMSVTTGSNNTYSTLILSTQTEWMPVRDFQISIQVATEQQLRTPTPNPWETFWLFFNYNSNPSNSTKTTNYFLLNTHGPELGTAFDSVGQTFLATPTGPSLTLGKMQTIQLTKIRTQVFVSVDGVPAISYTGSGIYDVPGSIGLYTEDARVHIYSVKLTPISYN